MLRLVLAAATLASAVQAAPQIAQAQQQDERYFFFLRDPFRPGARSPFFGFPRVREPVPPRPVEAAPEPEPPAAVVYGSSDAADRYRETPAAEYVLVLGDSLADQLAQGLVDAFGSDRPEVAVVKKTRGSSGLVRADFYDWPAQVPDLIADEKATAIVIMLGANDRQPLRDETGQHEVRSDRWRELYAGRVDAMLAAVKAKGVPVFVVGQPSMRHPRLHTDLPYINEILRERAQAMGATFVDIWDGFVDEAGEFVTFGPALDGQTRRLRIGDGVHFTRVGARKLAHYVERDLVRLFDQRAGRPAIPLEEPEPTPAGRPVAGPVLPLTQPMGPVGALAGDERPAVRNGDGIATRVLVEGWPVEPIAGRADDFRWPPPTATAAPAEPPAGQAEVEQAGPSEPAAASAGLPQRPTSEEARAETAAPAAQGAASVQVITPPAAVRPAESDVSTAPAVRSPPPDIIRVR